VTRSAAVQCRTRDSLGGELVTRSGGASDSFRGELATRSGGVSDSFSHSSVPYKSRK
jgi:hypothetical protein